MYIRKIKMPNNKIITFECGEDNESAKELIESFNKSLNSLGNDIENIDTKEYWQKVIEKETGNRNSTYIISNICDNIVTPIEINILQSRGYPTGLYEIIKYICDEIIKGRVDDWNSTENLRVRTAEVFVSLLQKQIFAAANEYTAKLLGGDKDAKLYINPTVVLSEVLNSQNVQQLENINPIEELSMMMKISPIGIGGITKSEAWPKQAMNIHYSYYGNVDPLETPDSENIGILQHLTIGSAITNLRGLFAKRDRKDINPLEVLGVGPSLVPFINTNEGARITMATAQAKQAIPLLNPETPAIQSGFESIYVPLLSEAFIKKAPYDGTITEVTDRGIIVKSNDNKITFIDTTPMLVRSGQGKHGLSVFKSTVTPGKKVKKDQIIAEGSNIKNGLISNGVNMLVAFMPWKGYNFEDGMVISESAAKKLSSMHLEIQHVYLDPEQDISHIVNLGDIVKKGDILLTYSSTLYDVETLNHLRADGGKIVNIEVYSNVEEENIPQALLPIFENFRREYILKNGKYPIGHFKEKNKKFNGILIKFSIQQELTLSIGDKLNNRFFNKGVVSVVVPDDQMAKTPWGETIDMIYPPLSVINRMNPGQLYEMHTGLISRHLSSLMTKKTQEQFINILNKVVILLDNTKGKIYSKNLISSLKAMPKATYDKLVTDVEKNKFFPLIFPPFKNPSRENVLSALNLLGLKTRYPLYLPEFNKTTEPVGVGYIYVMKLEHRGEAGLHARSTGPYVSNLLTPSAGKRKDGGQSLGEYDCYSLLAWDCPIVLDEMLGPLSADHRIKNEMISEIVQTGETSFRTSRSNPVKDLFAQYMTCIHLQSE